jgi:hypothetical protein
MSLRKFACLIVLECLIWAVPTRADIVSDWKAVALQTAISAHPGRTSILDLAMVHAAMHDAIQVLGRAALRLIHVN